jgi:hypothetical protein
VLAVWATTEEEEVENPVFCLIIEFIEGIPLNHEISAALPIHARDTICAKVSSQLRYLCELPSEGYYERVHGQEWLYPPIGIDTCTNTSPEIVGPYKTYPECISTIYRAWQV